MTLFRNGEFLSHSGKALNWKIECDALTDDDYDTIAKVIASKIKFSSVFGVPRGGTKLAHFLSDYISNEGPVLVVDDVLTTGRSMEEFRDKLNFIGHKEVLGIVLFSRGVCPDWIYPVFQLSLDFV